MAKRISCALLLMTGCFVAAVAEPGTTRDPFWPVGYVAEGSNPPPQEEQEQPLLDLSRLSPEEQAIIKSHMRVGGILEQGGTRVAIINRDVLCEGEKISINVRGQSYCFMIVSLEPQNIVLEPVKIEVEEKPEEEEENL